MKKEKIVFVAFIILLSIATVVAGAQAQSQPNGGATLTTERGIIRVKMENLQMINEYWMREQDGWYHETRLSQPGGPAGMYFSNQDHWFEMQDGKLVNDLLIISTAEDAQEAQRWIIHDGMRAELIGLKKNGADSLEYMKPAAADDLVPLMFPQVSADLAEIDRLAPFIDSILMSETGDDGLVHVRVEHSHHGNPMLSAHGLPPGRAVGMVSVYSYDAATGNRVGYSMSYLNPDLTAD